MPRSEDDKIKVKSAEATDEKYPWHLLRKTILLLNSFLGTWVAAVTATGNLMFSFSVWFNCWDHWTNSAGLEGPGRSHHWRSILHIDDELYRFSDRLFLYWISAGQAASLQISDIVR